MRNWWEPCEIGRMTNSPIRRVLTAGEWTARQQAHRARVEELTAAHLRRRSHGERHPVWDFMFNYYPTTPAKLGRWHPGAGVGLEVPSDSASEQGAGAPSRSLPSFKDQYGWWEWERCGVDYEGHAEEGTAWALDVTAHLDQRGKTIDYIERLLRATAGRAPQLGCFGLHEWAMVYRDTPRHPEPLRLGREETDAVVEASQLKCTHIDAFRFFTREAAPRNAHAPTRETQIQMEQPGCLHATMDLYKWATKLGPLVPGKLWLETFELACDVRRLDMEASPYDLREWGFDPVRIETPAGRAEYVRRQQGLMERGQRMRAELLYVIAEAREIAGATAAAR